MKSKLLLYYAGSGWTDSERQACLESLSADVWQLLLALLLAATPWVELLVAIPLGLVWGLPPVPLAAAVFLGNTLTIVPVVWLHDWWRARRAKPESISDADSDEEPAPPRTRRGRRAKRLWVKYGLPGLALLSPLVTGVHLAAAIALLSGATRRNVLLWFTLSVALWTVGLTVVVAAGMEGLRWLWSWGWPV